MKGEMPSLSWQFAYLGFCCLFGWNAILNVSRALSANSIYTAQFGQQMATIYGLTMSVTIIPLIFVKSDVIPMNPRAMAGGLLISASLAMIGFSAVTNPGSAAFGLAMAALLGIGTAIVQGFFYSEAATYSANAISMFSIGQSVSGLICLPIQLGLRQIFENDMTSTAAFAFLTAGACVLSIPVYMYGVRRTLAVKERTRSVNQLSVGRRPYSSILREIWPMTLCIFLNNMMLFLVLTNHVNIWNDQSILFAPSSYMLGMIAYFIYNLFDWIGRSLVSFGVKLNRTGVICLTLARLVPLAVWYVASFGSNSVMKTDYFRLGTLAVFVIMQGLAVTWSFILAPANITIAAEQPVVGNVNTLAIVAGIMVGSALGGVIDGPIQSLVQ